MRVKGAHACGRSRQIRVARRGRRPRRDLERDPRARDRHVHGRQPGDLRGRDRATPSIAAREGNARVPPARGADKSIRSFFKNLIKFYLHTKIQIK